MHRVVNPPPADRHIGWAAGGWWHQRDERVVCDLCPRFCVLKDGDRGVCFVRQHQNGQIAKSGFAKGSFRTGLQGAARATGAGVCDRTGPKGNAKKKGGK